MRYLVEVSVAAAFAGPKMQAMLGGFFSISGEVVFAKAQGNDFPNLKLQVFSGQKDFVSGNKCQHALVVMRKLRFDGCPVMFHHFPLNVGFRFSRKEETPSA